MIDLAPAQDAETSLEYFLARQPILDRGLDTVGYELLYRNSRSNQASFADGNHATANLLINTFAEAGINQIVGANQAYINVTREYIVNEISLPLHPRDVVLEVLEDVEADEEVLAGLGRLVGEGFTIAMDDFVLHQGNAALLPYAGIVKIDVLALDPSTIAQQVKQLARYDVKLLAEKVETQRHFDFCRELGFDYFQGYFFARPTIIQGKQLPPNQVTLLQLLAKLQSPDCELEEVEEIIAHDVGISYKLLKIINSSYYGLGKKVDSIQHALVVLGLNVVKQWTTILCLSTVQGKPDELINLSLIRAKMCERLAELFACRQGPAFTVGLFSLLDALLDQPQEKLVSHLPLAEEVSQALVARSGELGKLLSNVIVYEHGDWAALEGAASQRAYLGEAYLEAVAWASEVRAQLA